MHIRKRPCLERAVSISRRAGHGHLPMGLRSPMALGAFQSSLLKPISFGCLGLFRLLSPEHANLVPTRLCDRCEAADSVEGPVRNTRPLVAYYGTQSCVEPITLSAAQYQDQVVALTRTVLMARGTQEGTFLPCGSPQSSRARG